MVRLFFLTLLLCIAASCASMQSGHYIKMTKKDTVKSLSKEFNVPEWAIKEANKGRSIASGEWVFIPLPIGFVDNEVYDSPYGGSDETNHLIYSGEFLWPVPSCKKVSSKFGRRWGKSHQGIDIPARRGSHIVSIDDGVVVYSGNELGGYGNITVIAHPNGIFSIYAHADVNYTRKGQKIFKGQVIGKVGSTGRSTGPHLHFEMRRNSTPLNPKRFLASKYFK